MKKFKLRKKNIGYLILIILVLTYSLLRAFSEGNDINVYLFASKQLFHHENFYTYNPYNNYLYSPLFALMMGPLSILDFRLARVLWAIINIVVTVRLWYILDRIISEEIKLNKQHRTWWTVGIIILSAGFLNHNLNLGQITIVILWMTLEGLYQISKQQDIKGAALIALGINIKIVPMIALYYLFFKGKYKALIFSVAFVVISLFLPALFTGYQYNHTMLKNWENAIDPVGKGHVFEDNNGCISLNSFLPSFFYDFNSPKDNNLHGLKRKIAHVPYKTLTIFLQFLRVVLALSLLLLIFYRFKQRKNKLFYFYWEFSYLMLISLLVFPHQMKYTMLYFVPAGSYMILHGILVLQQRKKVLLNNKIIAFSSLSLMFLLAVAGRDVIGSYILDILDYYHYVTFIIILFLVFLVQVKPDTLVEINREINLPSENARAASVS